MPALSVLDLAMFVLESPDRHFNVGPLIVLDPPGRLRAGFSDKLYARLLKRPAGPPFTFRLQKSGLGLPSLEEDPHFDLARHVHRVTLDSPGSEQQLFDQVSKLHQTRLDRAQPLWQFYVIDGLQGGRVALFGKMHHGVIDGRTFIQVISNWLSVTPGERQIRAMWEGVPQQAYGRAAQASIADRVGQAIAQVAGGAGTTASLVRMLAGQALNSVRAGSTAKMMLPFTGIPKVLTGRASVERSFAYCTLPILEMKALGKAHGVSLNDLILLSLDVALDRYLAELGTRPDKPLVTAMPVALAGAKGGNQIAVLQFPLGGPGKSAVGRLQDIRQHTATIKDVVKREASETVMLYTALVHGVPGMLEKIGLPGKVAVSNMVVSNPFGFPEARYLMGAKVDLVLPLALVNAGQMLNVTAVTLSDQLQLAFLAIPDAVPRVEQLARYTREAFDGLAEQLAAPTVARKAPLARAARGRGATGVKRATAVSRAT
ncbi:wax ester/triacylglycerol synthase domain-containing protein [Variovorax sp. LARHSF232]